MKTKNHRLLSFAGKLALFQMVCFLFVINSCVPEPIPERSDCFCDNIDETDIYHYNCFDGLYDAEIVLANTSYHFQTQLILEDYESESDVKIYLRSNFFDLTLTALTDFYSIKGGSGNFNINNKSYKLTIASGFKDNEMLFFKFKTLDSNNQEFLITLNATKVN